MEYKDFNTDLEYSFRESDRLDQFYYRIFNDLKWIEFVEDKKRQKMGIDLILHFEDGYRVSIDEKKRREDYGDILLELWSNLDKKTPGWLFTCKCGYIAYFIEPAKKMFLLPALLLKRAWFRNGAEWQKHYPIRDSKNYGYVTRNIPIPPGVLLEAIYEEMKHFYL